MVGSSLDNLAYYSDKYDSYNRLSETTYLVLQCFKSEPERFMQTKDIVRITGIPRRTIIYTLNTLKEKKLSGNQEKELIADTNLYFNR